jgi:ligand-binding sensor protein
MRSDTATLGHLERSQIYRDYERAFAAATELPLRLRPLESINLERHGKRNGNPLCVILAESSETCAACLRAERNISDPQSKGSATVTCFAGLCETSVPVRLGDKAIGYLQTGQIALRRPTENQFKMITKQILSRAAKVDLKRLN